MGGNHRTEVPAAPKLSDAVRRRLVTGKRVPPIPPRERTGLEAVIGEDERAQVHGTEDFPWKLICSLEIDAPRGTARGTGWLAGPHTVITAGHCVFDARRMGGHAVSINVIPGRNGTHKPFSAQSSTNFISLPGWTATQDPKRDVAAIYLDRPFFPASEVFRIGAPSDAELQDCMVNISGYPQELGGGFDLYWAMNRVRALDPDLIHYDVDTSGGQSGAPVFILEDENAHPLVVGIHAYGTGHLRYDRPRMTNTAPRITAAMAQQLQSWIR